MGEDSDDNIEIEGIDASDDTDIQQKLADKRKEISSRFERRRSFYIVSAFIILVAVTALYSNPLDLVSNNSFSDSTDSQPEIEGEIVEVVVTDERAEPSRPEISPEDGIRFVNQASHDLNFTFDRQVDSFILEEGDSKVVDISAIVYYSVNPVEDVEFREIRAGVNVQ